jgi:hypothetical protein
MCQKRDNRLLHITITILDIIRIHACYLKHVLENGFRLRIRLRL